MVKKLEVSQMGSDSWLTCKQVAARWGVSQATVGRMLQRGDISGMKIGKSWRIYAASVAAYERKRGALLDAV